MTPSVVTLSVVLVSVGLVSSPALSGPAGSAKSETASPARNSAPERTNKVRDASRAAETKIEQSLKGRSMARTGADMAITARIKTVLLGDEKVSASDINVDTLKGVVHLRGTVRSKAEAQRAVAIAQRTIGVKAVKNHLKIAPSRNQADYQRRNKTAGPRRKPSSG